MLGAAAEFERALIRERTQAGRARYKQDFESGKAGRTVYSRSGRNLPPHRPRRVFDRDEVLRSRPQGWSYRQIEVSGLGTGDDRPDAAAVFQKFVVGTWSRGGGQG